MAKAWDGPNDLEEQKVETKSKENSFAISSLCEDMDELTAQLAKTVNTGLPLKAERGEIVIKDEYIEFEEIKQQIDEVKTVNAASKKAKKEVIEVKTVDAIS